MTTSNFQKKKVVLNHLAEIPEKSKNNLPIFCGQLSIEKMFEVILHLDLLFLYGSLSIYASLK